MTQFTRRRFAFVRFGAAIPVVAGMMMLCSFTTKTSGSAEPGTASRIHISAAGYGEYFTHRLGHFIGMEDHEKGDVSSVNTNTVQPDMIFSIEPGVYLPGEFGARVEDLVIATEDGCELLNHVDKHVKILGI